MFIKTIKVKKPGFWVLAVSAAIIIGAVILAVIAGGGKSVVYPCSTEKERQAFLKEMGWEVGSEYKECKVVIIPQKFNDVYTDYNKLQKEQGFDLEKFKGKTVEIYTYDVKNYPDHKENIVANLIVYEGELIGGDVSSVEIDGFMQGLKKG